MTPHYQDDLVTVYHGDCLDVMRQLPDASVDAVVTDPPYGLEFMGREWDRFRVDDPGTNRNRGERAGGQGDLEGSKFGSVTYGAGKRPATFRCTGCGKRDQFRNDHGCDRFARWVKQSLDPFAAPPSSLAFGEWCRVWATEALRVLKPGGHLLAFGGTRTWHRLACAVEDAGFEVRDSIAWLYGSGFPKSLDVSKAIDKTAGVVGERGPMKRGGERLVRLKDGKRDGGGTWGDEAGRDAYTYVPGSEEGKRWQGWGTALKPAFEPVVVARKPLSGTVAANVLTHGTGALNIDPCRIVHASPADRAESEAKNQHKQFGTAPGGNAVYGDFSQTPVKDYDGSAGRWPANVVLDESQAAELDRQSGVTKDGVASGRSRGFSQDGYVGGSIRTYQGGPQTYGGSGGASRFFPTFRYEAKAPTAERPRDGDTAHPTVKPLDLMRWLVRLVTPPGGFVLDPFAGTGTTAEACIVEGFRCITVEREASYLPLIVARLTKPIQPDLFGGAA